MSEENVEIVRGAYRGWAKATRWVTGPGSSRSSRDELELRPAGTYLDAASSYRGREGWARFWRDFSAVWEEWHFDPDAFEFFAAGEKVVVFARAVGIGKESGVKVIQDEAHLWTIRDGKMLLGVSFMDRTDALEAAGLSE
jgi:ketosteroid isomerase-like protein